MSNKILILGGTGFLGGALVEALCQQGDEVMIVARNVSKAEDIFSERLAQKKPKLKITEWNFKSTAFTEFLADAKCVINLTGEGIIDKPWRAEQKKKLLQSRVKPVKLLAQGLQERKKKLSLYIGASAIGYYPFGSDDNLTESADPGKHFLSELCCIWEEMHASIPARRKVILRIGVVLGAKGGMLKKILPFFRWGLGSHLGNGRQYMSWIALIDIVKIIRTVIKDQNYQGTYNAVSPHIITNFFFSKTIAKILCRSIFLFVPAFLLKCLLGERSILLLGSQKIYPAALKKQGFIFSHENFLDAIKYIVSKNRG